MHIQPTSRREPITLLERGAPRAAYAEAYISGVGKHVADRELAVIARRLKWTPEQLRVRGIPGEMGPGPALILTLEYEQLTEYLLHPAPVGPHLADQLLLPMALGGLAKFATCEPTPHFLSNADVIAAFMGKHIVATREGSTYVVTV